MTEQIAAGGQPNPGTPADKRLKKNKPAKKVTKKAAPKMSMYPPKPKKP